MMTAPPLPGWYPLLRARALSDRPITRLLAGSPLRLWRDAGGIRAVDAATGAQRRAQECGGWIMVAEGDPPTERPPAPLLMDRPFAHILIDGSVCAAMGDVGENILDTTHTSVVHQDYLRRPGARRPVDVLLASGEGWISATYPPGAAPGGWGARLLGAHRYTIRDTFRAPGIAEVSYTEEDRPVFAARFCLTPVSGGETFVAATLAVPGRGLAATLKLAALRLFFQRIFDEDRAILESIGMNRASHGAAPIVYAPQDILRPGIEAILAGRRPAVPAARIALLV